MATPPYWQITTVPPVQNFSQSTPFEITDSVNFGFYPTQFIQDLELTGCLHGTRPGGTGQQWILWKNNGTTLAGPDTLTLTLDSNLHFTGSNPSPAIVNGPVIQWVYPVLTPFATGRIELHYTVDSLAVIGDSVLNSIEIAPVGTDATPGNNVVEVSDIIRGSFDPNEKSVTPAGTGIQGYISPFEELTYTIYFQNTGNDTALNITLFDLLNENLDISTLKFNGSSHACNWFLDFNRQLIFRFPAINLPDSSTNEVMSHGFVSFSIRPKPGLPDQTVITNSAGIVFDFNAPILTNQVINTIQLILGEEQTTPDRNGIRVYPNPAGDNLWIHRNAADPVFRLKLMDMTGKVLIQEEVCRNSCRLETGSLAPGVYMIMAWNGRQVDYTRFVKQ